MKFSITDLLIVTSAYATLLVLARTRHDIFWVVWGILFCLQILFPIAFVLTHILFLDQRGQVPQRSTSRVYVATMKMWLLSLICFGLFYFTMRILWSA